MDFSKILPRWNLLTAMATAICTCISGFLVLPAITQYSTFWAKFGVFAVTILVGLWLVPMQLYATRKALRFWVACAIVSFLAANGAYFEYSRIVELWTFDYQGQPVVAGVSLSSRAAAYREASLKQERILTEHDLLWWSGGNIADVWPIEKEREYRTSVILEFYLMALLLFSSTVVTVVQSTYCANVNAARGRPS